MSLGGCFACKTKEAPELAILRSYMQTMQEESMEELLTTETTLCGLFEDFLKEEYAEENLQFYLDSLKYRDLAKKDVVDMPIKSNHTEPVSLEPLSTTADKEHQDAPETTSTSNSSAKETKTNNDKPTGATDVADTSSEVTESESTRTTTKKAASTSALKTDASSDGSTSNKEILVTGTEEKTKTVQYAEQLCERYFGIGPSNTVPILNVTAELRVIINEKYHAQDWKADSFDRVRTDIDKILKTKLFKFATYLEQLEMN